LFLFSFYFLTSLFFCNYCFVRMIWISTKPCVTCGRNKNPYMNKYAYKYTYFLSVILLLSETFGVYCSLEKSDVLWSLLLIQ
jgi:hypothetical protein